MKSLFNKLTSTFEIARETHKKPAIKVLITRGRASKVFKESNIIHSFHRGRWYYFERLLKS